MSQTAIGYIRVSTQDQVDEGVSLDAQRDKIAAWCTLHDYELVDVHQDAGITGSTMSKRPGLQEALDAVGKGSAPLYITSDAGMSSAGSLFFGPLRRSPFIR